MNHSSSANPARDPSDRRVEAIHAQLVAAFEPCEVRIRDDSALHAGHAGARDGGHYWVSIVSKRFAGLPARERHRLVYAALGNLPERGIHALSIETHVP